MKNTKRILLAAVAALLLVAVSVGGTMAWLVANTDSVVNTFTPSDITITLAETTGTSYKMVPGATITKDPLVTVKANSEKCYLFVKVEKSTNFGAFMTYEMAAGWTELTGVSGVYYRVVDASTADQEFGVINNNTVTVKDAVTKEMMHPTTDTFSNPTLTITAYASQYMKNNTESFTAAEAWTNAQPTVTP
ncbi:MAG: hypothetical protein ACI4ME_10390 [Aristaeellaceae bacterium]